MALLNKSLDSILENENKSLEEVLKFDSVVQLYTQSYPSLVRYLMNHLREILDLALTSENNLIRANATLLIASSNSMILEALLSQGIFTEVFSMYFFQENPKFAIIGRIAHIMEMCLLDFFDESSSQFYFISEAVRFLDNPTLVEALVNCIKNEYMGKDFIQWISDLEIDYKLVDAVDQLSRSKEVNTQYAIGLFEVLDELLKNEQVLSKFSNPSSISMLVTPIEKLPLYVKYYQWQLVLDIVNVYTIPFITPLSSLFTNLLTDTSNGVHFHNILGFQILSKILVICPEKRKTIGIETMFDFAFKILYNFQGHSIALNAVSDFLIDSAQKAEYRNLVLDKVIPFADNVFQQNAITTIQATCYKMFKNMKYKVDWNGYEKNTFDKLYLKYVARLFEIENKEYGQAYDVRDFQI
ncbi:hypothetical protein GPJ56_007677 [Histomonas meleagridis]|uniref:uncharacterized protein n=1 Tax=Histomonas meleagridis TaxID=135588 RepID=UPI00355A55A5|nr:hypothetical protein GPJ56_007677 [Histomonas meleagridis]KAH0805870.1 hypothetical protein GO595_001304 [Histomonas meleagridis]